MYKINLLLALTALTRVITAIATTTMNNLKPTMTNDQITNKINWRQPEQCQQPRQWILCARKEKVNNQLEVGVVAKVTAVVHQIWWWLHHHLNLSILLCMLDCHHQIITIHVQLLTSSNNTSEARISLGLYIYHKPTLISTASILLIYQ